MTGRAKPVDLRLLTKVSKLYYEQHLTQQAIADRLQLSRPTVSRLLQQAQARGLVHISVLTPPGYHTQLEQALEQQFGLQEAVVITAGAEPSHEALARVLGAAAAQYVHRMLQPGDVIGLSWGTTLNAMVNALAPIEANNVHVVQIIGGLGAPEADVHATDIARRFARLLNGRLTLIAAPGIVDTLETKQALLTDSHVQQAFNLFSKLTMAFVGIGVPLPTSIVMRGSSILSRPELDHLLEHGAVGDIGLRFFDAAGQPVRSTLDERVIGISLDELQRVARVIGIAGGLQKIQAVCGALRGKLINVLITDHLLANALLECSAPPVEDNSTR